MRVGKDAGDRILEIMHHQVDQLFFAFLGPNHRVMLRADQFVPLLQVVREPVHPQQRFHPHQQLGLVDRLADEVRRAESSRLFLGRRIGQRGEEDDRRIDG